MRPQLASGSPLPGDTVDGVVHLAAFVDDNEEPAGACLIFPEDCAFVADGVGAWRLRSMATSLEARGTGAGAAVLDAAHSLVKEAGAPLLWCHARENAVGFYARHGWQIVGDPFEEIDIPHRNMFWCP